MGILRRLFRSFGSEGIRDAMRDSYLKHRNLAITGAAPLPPGETPHSAGLFGALATRYKARHVPRTEFVVLSELVPFMLMHEELAVQALIEYVVYQERPQDTNVAWLRNVINQALRSPAASDESPRALAPMGMINNVSWQRLLDFDVAELLRAEAQKISAYQGAGKPNVRG